MLKRYYISFLFLAMSITLWGQKEEQIFYYGVNGRRLDGPHDARVYKELIKRSDRKFILKTFQLTGDEWNRVSKERIREHDQGELVISIISDGLFPKRISRQMEKSGPDTWFFRESTSTATIRTGTTSRYLPLHLDGTVLEYHPFGELKSRSEYRDNQLIVNENWLQDGTPYIDSVFYSAHREPEYQMGNDFFRSYLLQQLKQNEIDLTQIDDRVVIGFVVMETGDIDGVIALQGKSRQLNQILVDIIAGLPGHWQPAVLDGSTVRYFMRIPLNFMQQQATLQDLEFSGGIMFYNKY